MILWTQPGKQSLNLRGCSIIAIVDDKSLEINNSTQSKGKEGQWLSGKINLANLILSADGQGGGPVGCPTARIGCWKLRGLQEIASQDYRHVTTCASVRDIQKGWA